MTPTAVLALMLVLGTPGLSTQSAMPLEQDGDHTCAKSTDPGCRKETRQEGLERWLTIATAIALEANDPDDGVANGTLARALVVTTRAESAWWRSVHWGITRGDNGKARCLVQRNWGTLDDGADVPESTELEAWRARDLDGVGLAPTRRCIAVGARLLRKAIRACGGADPACWWIHYGGNVARTDPRILDRVRWFGAIEGRRLHLPPQLALELAAS